MGACGRMQGARYRAQCTKLAPGAQEARVRPRAALRVQPRKGAAAQVEHGRHKQRGGKPPQYESLMRIHLRRGAFTALRGMRVQPRKGAAAQVEHGRHKLRGEGRH